MKSSTAIAAATLLLLCACGRSEEANNSGVTAEESLALNETDNMLDTSPDSLIAAEGTPLGNGEAPAEDVANTGDLPVTDVNAQ